MNENKFTGKAELYSKYRPSYPEKLIDWLYDMTNAEAVADIGAGTGIFTSALRRDDSGYDGFVCELENAFSKHEKGGKVSQNYITECYLGSF